VHSKLLLPLTDIYKTIVLFIVWISGVAICCAVHKGPWQSQGPRLSQGPPAASWIYYLLSECRWQTFLHKKMRAN